MICLFFPCKKPGQQFGPQISLCSSQILGEDSMPITQIAGSLARRDHLSWTESSGVYTVTGLTHGEKLTR